MSDKNPIHPGEHLAEILSELGITQYRLAKGDWRAAATHQRNRAAEPRHHG